MAIFANQSAIRFSSTPVDIIARRPIPNNAILVYDSKKGAFVTSGKTSLPAVEGASSTGGANTYSIFKEKSGNELIFKSLEAGVGIDIESTSDVLTISATSAENRVVSETDYFIVIDSNNNEPDAKFELLTGVAAPANPIEISLQSTVLIDQDVWIDNSGSRGFIQSTGATNFAGTFFENQFLEISDAGDPDGEYIIDEILSSGPTESGFPSGNSTIYLQSNINSPTTLPDFFNQITLIAWDLYATSNTTIETSFTDLGPNGFDLKPGMEIQISGSENGDFDGVYEIDNVVSLSSATGIKSVLSLNSNTPLPDTGFIKDSTPLSPAMKISVIEYIDTTGFSVSKTGVIRGSNLILTEDITGRDLVLSGDIISTNIDNSDTINTTGLTVTNTTTDSLVVNTSITTQTMNSSGAITTDHVPVNNNDVTTKDWIENNTVSITSLTGAAQLPSGTTAQRPSNPQEGMIRYNTDTFKIEACAGGVWVNLH